MKAEVSLGVDEAGKYMVSVRRDGNVKWETVRFETRALALKHLNAVMDCMWTLEVTAA